MEWEGQKGALSHSPPRPSLKVKMSQQVPLPWGHSGSRTGKTQLQTPTRRIINRKESSIKCASSGKVFFASPTRNQLPSLLSQWKPVITLNSHFIQWWSRSVMSNSLWPPWTVTCQVPSSMEFSREGYWSGLTFVQNNPSSFLLSVYKITFLSFVCWLCLQLFLLPNCNALLFWINPFCPYTNKMFSFLG